MTTITITLPEDLARQAKTKGLLSPAALEQLIGEAVKRDGPAAPPENPVDYPPDFDPRLRGAVNPLAFKRGKITGDIIGPFHEVWGESE